MPAASWQGCEERTCRRGTRSPSLDGWAAYTPEFRFWWTDHSSCLGEDPTLPLSGPLYFWLIDMRRPGQPCIKGRPHITGGVDPMNWLPEELYGSGLGGCTYRSLRRASRCYSRRWITRMLGRFHVYTYNCQTSWLLTGSQSGSRYVGPASWLINMVVWQKLYLPCSSFAHKRNLTCDKVSDGIYTAWNLHVWI